MNHQNIAVLINLAIEASIYVAPMAPGLTRDEMQEVAGRMGYKPGEVSDAMNQHAQTEPSWFGRLGLREHDVPVDFHDVYEVDYRNIEAFEFVCLYFRELAANVGEAMARAERSVVVNHGIAKGIPEHDLQVALSTFILARVFEKGQDNMYAPMRGKLRYPLPSEQRAQAAHHIRYPHRKDMKRIYSIVKDVVERRTDGRSPAAEPIRAFEHALDGLDCSRFRMWWAQTSSELSLTNDATSPMTTCVLSAALAEGALTLIVKRAQKLGLATMASKTFGQSPTSWKFDELLSSAAAGGADAIFDQKVRDRAARLNGIRNRIHVGRLMAEQPTGPIPDTRPEEAREARETLDAVLRSIVDWLNKHPAPAAPSS